MKGRNYSDFLRMVPGMVLVLALLGIVFGTGITTKQTIEQQAMEYLEQASERSAEELKKAFHRQEENVQTMAHMTAHIMEYEFIDTEKLVHLTEHSSFDGIEYIHKSGTCYGMDKQSWHVEDKAYFQDAMQLHAGYAYDNAPDRAAGGCLVFYAPILSDDGVFNGILAGYLREENLAGMLDISFWGHSTKQYLCTPEGMIIAANDSEQTGKDILEIYEQCGCMTADECQDLVRLLKDKDGNFKYAVDDKTELGSICPVDDGKLLLVETFPPEVLSELTAPMLDKMRFALVHIVISLIVYGVILFVLGRKTKLRLLEENDKMTRLWKGAEGLANQDGLTGLYNRRGMMELIDKNNLEEKQIAFMILDIDNFKRINDNFGHQVGDELLMKVADLLKESFRAEDILVRMGGDEFVIILPDFKLEQADIIKNKVSVLNDKLKNPVDSLPAATVSVGAAFSRPDETEELYKRADKALYEMKAQGRCGCCIYEEVFEAV